MKWFYIEVTDAHGVEYHDECRASDEPEARTAIESLGYSINVIRVKRLKTWILNVANYVDRLIHPERHDPQRILEKAKMDRDHDNNDSNT